MVRSKTSKTAVYVNLSQDDISNIVLASAGTIKDKEVDPRKLVGTIHIKKYLADLKINGKVEAWITVLKKLIAPLEEGQDAVVLTSEELATLEECKAQTKVYLGDDASDALKKKASESGEEYKTLKEVSSSMKFKFSRHAYETVTHVINLMVREILAFTCDNCASQKAKLTKIAHIPWHDLQTKLLAGMYMNTKAVYYVLHPEEATPSNTSPPDGPVETVDEVEVDVEAEVEVEVEDSGNDEVKAPKPRLSQYISNTFKEITARDERFKGLLLGKEITSLVNDIVYNVLDRYANVIKSLLQTGNSKTVNERLAIISTKVLLQDHVHATDADVAVVLDVVQARLEDLKNEEKDAPVDNEESGLSDANTKP
jgi:hypothetical protein